MGGDRDANPMDMMDKDDVGKTISVSEYNEACRGAVMKYTQSWNHLTEKMEEKWLK